MTNLQKRLILTLGTVPLVIASMFLPQDTHIFLILAIGILIVGMGSYEINNLIYQKGIKVRRWFIPLVNSVIFVFSYFYINNFFNVRSFKQLPIIFIFLIIGVISFVYARDVFRTDLTKSFEKMSYTLFGILYIGIPAFLLPCMFNIDFNPSNPVPFFYNINSTGTLTGSLLTLYFLCCVWTNDIFAYVFGMAFGKKNKIGLAASPNKSWAGYIGGFISSYIFIIAFYFLFRNMLQFETWVYFVFPGISGIVSPIGDLVESVFKRSANVKDSGTVILGRGGILDSVDTILYVYPIFFILIELYFSFKT